jgi:predicted ATPase/class 3 adenylate cyclase
MPEAITERRPIPSGTVTFLFTDIEGSTERWERYRQAMQAAVGRHEDILHAAINAHDGYVFKTVGDAFCATFRTAPDALGAALDAQRELAKEDFSAVSGLKVRMAVHTGLSYERSGDYFGPTVNRVARLLSIGHGGQVLVSGAASDLAQGELPPKITFRDLGAQRLKDLAQPEQVYQLVAPDLTQDFPPLRSLDALPNNLPIQVTSFVGRDEELALVKQRLSKTRLLTLVGAGGIGKTRLALQAGAELLDQYEDGVWLIEFGSVSDPDLVPSVVAGVLSVAKVENRSLIESVVYALRPKSTLLILDNCEHLVEPLAKVIDAILHGCPHVRLLASSRQGLGVDGEALHRVSSLAVPDSLDGLTAQHAASFGAIALFVERAGAIVDTFALTDANVRTVANICQRLDGIALAIELAAPRLKALSVEQLSDRLAERFRLLTGGKRTALQRQQTMRALIDWSYDLLSEAEKMLLRRVAIFAGGWTLDAATEICADEHLETWDVLDLMTSLVDKSLVVAELQGTSQRYRLLESTREYALEKLDATGERQVLARKHAEYFTRVARSADQAFARTPLQPWMAPLELEVENFRAALNWSLIERRAVQLGAAIAGSLESLWIEGGMEAEGRQWVNAALGFDRELVPDAELSRLFLASAAIYGYEGERVVQAAKRAIELYEQLGDRIGVARARFELAQGLFRMGRDADMEQPLREALETFRSAGDAYWTARCLDRAGLAFMLRGDVDPARKTLSDALAVYQARGDDTGCDRVLANLGELEFAVGNADRAIELVQEALAIDLRLKRKSNVAISYNNIAAYRTSIGQYDEARNSARAGLRTAREAQHPVMVGIAVQHLALIAALRGDARRSAQLTGYSDAAFKNAGSQREPTEQKSYERIMATLREHLDETQLSSALAEGGAMQEDQAIEEALRV